jgi:tricorn protease
MRPTMIRLASLAAAVLAVTAPTQAQTKLLRFPDIYASTVVFTYAGDLWKAPSSGGVATRLTAHPGQELFAKFSPDGRWIAFTGQYDGDEQVYVIPADGGVPKQLTFYPARGPLAPRWGYDHQVYGWTPDGKAVLFRSLRDANGGSIETALYTVSMEGGLPVKLPMPTAGAGNFSPDMSRMVYSPLFRDFRTWKRYEGGWAQDLYLFDLSTSATRPVAPSHRTERDPMWIGDAIYFASDRDGTLNLFAWDLSSDSVRQLTTSTTWDVRWPSSDNREQIVFELGGELQILNIRSGETTALSITVPDDGLAMRPSQYSAAKTIEDYELSPRGERALFVARGDVFTAPIEHGPTRNLTNSSNAHDRWARWSPDGKSIAFVSDLSGEDQVYIIDQEGFSPPEQVTTGLAAMLYTPRWSPDGSKLAFSDKDGKLYVVTVASRQLVEIADDAFDEIRDYAWAPGSDHLAFSMAEWSGFRTLHIWSEADGIERRITAEEFNAFSPVWDPEGRYLYYLSDRTFAPQISTLEWNFATNRMTGVFALALRPDVPPPFPVQSDEVRTGPEKSPAKSGQATGEVKGPLTIAFDGLASRLSRVPVEADNLDGLTAKEGSLLYVASGPSYYGRSSDRQPALKIFSFDDRKEETLVEDIGGYALSCDGSKVLVLQKGAYKLYDAMPKAKDPKIVSTKGLLVDRIPALEWQEIFNEVWRRYRDFFYVRNLHGYDWNAIGAQYRSLLTYVAHRSDLNYVLGEMVAELNVGHAYIEGGDFEIPERPKVGLPGARFALDRASGRYRITKIFAGQNAEERYRAPLTELGVDARVGDYVLAIDGEELTGTDNPYRLLRHKTDPVRLTLNERPVAAGARTVTYTPIFSEQALLYLEWVEGNRARVEKASGGKVGYMHLPDMGASGSYEFIKWFYPQIRKEGMVIDVRSNGGGNISQWIIERLDTKVLGTRFGYNSDKPITYPYTAFYGHKVCLINQTSASDGDIFPHYFRKAGLGPLIGKRTWGGVVGISNRGPLLDGGTVYVPLRGTNELDGSWVIEGEGVRPDIEVENDPASVIQGRDPQLERAIEEVMKKVTENPLRLPQRPPDPVKTKSNAAGTR